MAKPAYYSSTHSTPKKTTRQILGTDDMCGRLYDRSRKSLHRGQS